MILTTLGYAHVPGEVVPTTDAPAACVEAVFVHHGFEWPLSNGRPIDEGWQAILGEDTVPAPAPWPQVFMR